MVKKLLVLTLIFTLIFSSVAFAFPGDEDNENSEELELEEEKKKIEKDKENGTHGENKSEDKSWQELENEKGEIEVKKQEVESEKNGLKKEYEEAKSEEDTQKLKEKIGNLEGKIEELKEDMKAIQIQRRKIIRNQYTVEELERIDELKEEFLETEEDIEVLDVDIILSKEANVKFDTPPIIKENRTLVPVRAIVEGFGAQVEWNEERREVMIVKEDQEILLPLDYSGVYVNGEKVQLDTKSEVMNSRTYVPLRFIAEVFGLEVEWHGETGIIELDEESTGEKVIIEEIDNENVRENDNLDVEENNIIIEAIDYREEIIIEDLTKSCPEERRQRDESEIIIEELTDDEEVIE